jgi:hypothetical protein
LSEKLKQNLKASLKGEIARSEKENFYSRMGFIVGGDDRQR